LVWNPAICLEDGQFVPNGIEHPAGLNPLWEVAYPYMDYRTPLSLPEVMQIEKKWLVNLNLKW